MSLLNKAFRKIFPSKQAKRVRPWLKVNGDKTFRLDYDLNEQSIVFDLGGYEGQWASDIFSKFQCEILVFEPFSTYAKNIQERFKRNSKIRVFDFGLGKDDKRVTLYSNNDASSVYSKGGQAFEIEIRKASTFLTDKNISWIDLIKINIEGGEYDLLEELIGHGVIRKIKNIQVQFHDFVPEARERMKKIQNCLAITHQVTFQYEFVWENWELRR
jgi:FkbM family methyltransferase